MSIPVLYPRGTLLILHVSGQPPGRPVYVPSDESVEYKVAALCAEYNAGREGEVGNGLIGWDDFLILPIFDKNWCGAVDLSGEGVAALEDWDTAFARLQVSKLIDE